MPFTVTTPTSGGWTYTRLQAAVANWLNRSDLTSYIPDFITFAESRLNRELRIREMETSFSLVIPKSEQRLKYSNTFDNDVWTKTKSSVTSGQTDPEGGETAYAFTEDATAGNHSIKQLYTHPAGEPVSIRIKIKPGGRTRLLVQVWDTVATTAHISCYPILSGAGSITYDYGTATIELDVNGFYIIEAVSTTDFVNTQGQFVVYLLNSSGDSSYTGDGASGVFIWQSQLEAQAIGTYRESTSTTLTALNKTPVPSDYLELKHAYLTTAPQVTLERTSPSALYKRYSTRTATNKPTAIARDGDYFVFGPFPDSEYTVEGIYYAKFASLSSTTTYNWLLVNAPEVYLYGALIEAEPFIKNDPRMQMWEQKYQAAINRLQNESDREAFSGQGLRIVV